MKISEIITDRYKLRMPPTVYYELLADVVEIEEQESTTKNDLAVDWEELKSKIFMEVDGGTDDNWLRYSEVCDRISNSIDDFKANLPSVTPQEPRWIPVSERLPDTDNEVLCWYEYYHWSKEKVLPEYGFGNYFKETKSWFGEVAIGKGARVIAWMPLPKPYEPKEE